MSVSTLFERHRKLGAAMSVSTLFERVKDEVLEEESGHVRILSLNRPQKLNAISFAMVDRLLKKFRSYEKDSEVKLVILKGRGKAFCAGGDAADLCQKIVTDGHWSFATNLYSYHLKMNYMLATNKKIQVSLINGIVMGGGAGVSMNGKFRVVTENAVFSMPETLMGLFPDVGASYFLSRLPGFFGEYLGLCSTRLGAAELLACGLATHFVPAQSLQHLEAALKKVESSDPAVVSSIIDEFVGKPVLKEDSPFCRLHIIDKCFSKETVEEILSALETEDANRTHKNDAWIPEAIKSMKRASPLSLKIFLKSIRDGRRQGIGQCLVREYNMLSHAVIRTVSNDAYEGIRALLIEKDKKPKWNPPKLKLVSKEMVDKYFFKVDDEDWKELELPNRSEGLTAFPDRSRL